MPLPPEDPTSLEGLTSVNFVARPPGWVAYDRDALTDEERAAWDARVTGPLEGDIVIDEQPEPGIYANRLTARHRRRSYYVVKPRDS